MSEILRPTSHALVARFIYGDTYPLTPGSGIVFIGEEDKTSDAYSFEQSEIEYVLQRITPGTLQLMSLLDQNSGNLIFTQGSPDRSWGIGRQLPKGRRQMAIEYGRIQFAGIWRESLQEVHETLQILQKGRTGMN